MNELQELVNTLIKEKAICFSFESPSGVSYVKVRECEDYDFVEYGEEYKEGEMFEIGPTTSDEPYIETKLRFKDIYEAGDYVLQQRAQILGVPWGNA